MQAIKSAALSLVLLLSFSAAAHAQLAVYGTVSVEHVTGLKCLDTVCGSNNGTISPVGGGGGVYYDWRTFGPARIGFDVRASSTVGNKNAVQYASGPQPRIYSALGGVRASFQLKTLSLRPYVQGSVGWDRTNANAPLTYGTGVEFRGVRGCGLPVFPVWTSGWWSWVRVRSRAWVRAFRWSRSAVGWCSTCLMDRK